jgi:hypothetical protein
MGGARGEKIKGGEEGRTAGERAGGENKQGRSKNREYLERNEKHEGRTTREKQEGRINK